MRVVVGLELQPNIDAPEAIRSDDDPVTGAADRTCVESLTGRLAPGDLHVDPLPKQPGAEIDGGLSDTQYENSCVNSRLIADP